jgi:hypothetical protein
MTNWKEFGSNRLWLDAGAFADFGDDEENKQKTSVGIADFSAEIRTAHLRGEILQRENSMDLLIYQLLC